MSFQDGDQTGAVSVPTITRNFPQMDVIPGSIHKSSQDLPDNGDAAGAEGEPNHPTHVCNTAILPLKHLAIILPAQQHSKRREHVELLGTKSRQKL